MTKLLQRAIDLTEKTGMSWIEAEKLALEEVGIGDGEIIELIGNCSHTAVITFVGDEDLRSFTRSVLVHQPANEAAKAQQEQPASVDAYVGAREDAAIWKKRALEAEELNRKFIAEVNGPTYLGEPVKQEQPAQEPVAWLHGTTFQVVVSKNRPNSLAAWLPLFAHPAPTQPVIKPVVVNADYREMWQQVIELNQQLCEKLAEPPTQPALLSDAQLAELWNKALDRAPNSLISAAGIYGLLIEAHCRGGNHG